ncbi:MAG: amidase [Pseudomonadota bacterium]
MDITQLEATAIIERFRDKSLDPVDLMEACLERVSLAEPHLNAFCHLKPEAALNAAKSAARRWSAGEPSGVLDGVPFAAKDLCPVSEMPYRRGSLRTPDEPSDISTPLYNHVTAAGAVNIGKTTTPEFGWKGVTDSPLTGITRNPWNVARTPGGSSGGAGAAVASGMVPIAEGTDGAGSIRMPAAFCGLFGLYPTAGRIPYVPVSTLGTITQAGPMARSVRDGALLFEAMMGDDPRDPINLPSPRRDWLSALEGGVSGLRLAYCPQLNGAQPDPDVAAVMERVLGLLSDLGAEIVPVDDMFPRPVRPLFEVIYATAMARIRTVYPNDAGLAVDPGFEAMADQGDQIGAVAFAEAMYERDVAATALNVFFQDYDALLTPQMPLTAFEAGCDFPGGRGMSHWFDWSPYTYPFNFTNHPAGTMPCGFGDDGLPLAFQIVAPRYREDRIFRIAAAFEADNPIKLPGIAHLD